MTIEQLRATKGEFKSATALYERIKVDSELKQSIEKLYFDVFSRKLNKGCSNCWFDAYVELIYQPIEKIMSQIECKFALRAGALLIDVTTGDNKKMATNNNLTDELAIYHLKTNPSCRKFFTKPEPKELDSIIASFTKDKTSGAKDKAQSIVDKLQSALNKAEMELDAATQSNDAGAAKKANTAIDKLKPKLCNALVALAEFEA